MLPPRASEGSAGDYRPARKVRPATGSGALQQRRQAAAAVERDQVVAAADMGVADEDLRHRAPAREVHHGGARLRVAVDADLLDLIDTLGLEDLLRANAVRANGGGVHLDGLHRGYLVEGSGLFKRQISVFPGFE